MAAYRRGMTYEISCGLTACTPGSALGPTLGNEYGITLPFYYYLQITFPVRVVASLGVEVLIATNACGSLNPEYNVGDFVIISDHINLPGLGGLNPLIGLCDDRYLYLHHQHLTGPTDWVCHIGTLMPCVELYYCIMVEWF